MTEEKKESFNERYEKREAERQAAEDSLRLQLAEIGFDGPFKIKQADAFGGLFGQADIRYAICIGPETGEWKGCGGMVRLDDPKERGDGQPPIERGIALHVAFHQEPR